MRKLFIKSFVLLLPFLVFMGYFFIADPMKIIHNTKNPVSPGVLMNDRLFLARHLENTDVKYNAFIFGSSRSKAFKTWDWKNQIDKKALPFHMGVNDESLYGIERKLHFLDSLGFKIDYALIPLDQRLLSLTKNSEAHIFREYHALTDETSTSFYQRFFIAFLNPSFLTSYWNYSRTGEITSDETFLWDPGFTYHHKTGDIDYTRMDEAIKKDSLQFYQDNAADFHPRSPSESKQLLKEDAIKLLESIRAILKKHGTEYHIFVTPNYDQVAINQQDLDYLNKLFPNEVSNWSGVNAVTQEIGNYYEHKHFKPFIARSMMILSQINFHKGSRLNGK